MSRPRLADLFCCAGGAAMGYARAGFEVVGFDVAPQGRYPFEFRQRDVLTITPEELAAEFDAIHASPPCQFGTSLKAMHNARDHPNLIPQTRALLKASGLPYIIENVEGARRHLHHPIRLCGTAFGLGVRGADLQRHRYFEPSFPILFVPPCQHGSRVTIGVYGGHVRDRRRRTVIGIYGHGPNNAAKWRKAESGLDSFNVEDGREAMSIDWMTQAELSQAIPPAYTEWLGRHLLAALSPPEAA